MHIGLLVLSTSLAIPLPCGVGAITRAKIEVDSKPVADAEITFRVMAFPDPKFRTSMGEVAQRIGFPVEASGHD